VKQISWKITALPDTAGSFMTLPLMVLAQPSL